MIRSPSGNPHIAASKIIAENLKSMLKTGVLLTVEDHLDLIEIVPVAAVALLLIDIVKCIEKIEQAVQELACLASFKTVDSIPMVKLEEQPNLWHQGTPVQPPFEGSDHHVVTSINECVPENGDCLATRAV